MVEDLNENGSDGMEEVIGEEQEYEDEHKESRIASRIDNAKRLWQDISNAVLKSDYEHLDDEKRYKLLNQFVDHILWSAFFPYTDSSNKNDLENEDLKNELERLTNNLKELGVRKMEIVLGETYCNREKYNATADIETKNRSLRNKISNEIMPGIVFIGSDGKEKIMKKATVYKYYFVE